MWRLSFFIVPVASLAAGACDLWAETGPAAELPRPQAPVQILAYNVKAQETLGADPARGARIAAQVSEIDPDLMAFSECDPCGELVDQLAGDRELVTAGRVGVTAAYDSARWRVIQHGLLTLGHNDDGWGERVAMWVAFEEIASGAPLLFYSTHWCSEHRRSDDGCHTARQVEYAHTILDHAAGRRARSLPVVVAGDLNIHEGSSSDAAVRAFTDAGYIDALRAIQPTGKIVTLNPGARVDYIFASTPVDVLDAYADDSIPFELGSDHRPVIATLRLR